MDRRNAGGGGPVGIMGSCCQCSAPTGEVPTPNSNSDFREWFVFGLLAAAAGLSMTATLAINLNPPGGLSRIVIHTLLASITLVFLLGSVGPLLRRLTLRRLNLELLFLVALTGTLAASIYSSLTGVGHVYYEVVLVLLAIYRFGRLMTRRQLATLGDLSTQIPGLSGVVRVVDGENTRMVNLDDVMAGDIVLVLPEEVIPVDGKIVDGKAYFEELPHTGEPFPVPKARGAQVLAGARVLDGRVFIENQRNGRQREIDRIEQSVRSASRTRSEKLAQRLLNWFVPLVFMVATGTFLVRGVLLQQWEQAIFDSLAVTIVACPCGLGIAIPLLVRRAHFELGLLGIRPNCDDFLERLSRVTAIGFDKTGTLSFPALRIGKLERLEGAPAQLESWLAAIQLRSTHPVARAFWQIAEPAPLESLQIEPIPACGVRATFKVNGESQVLQIGNHDLIAEEDPGSSRGSTKSIHILQNERPVARAHLVETPRRGTDATLEELRESGLSIEIITGDSQIPTHLRQGVDQAHTSMSSREKRDLITAGELQGTRYLYVGDGLNDGEAFLAAHVSLGLGSGGAFAARTASAELNSNHLNDIPRAIRLARQTRKRLERLMSFVTLYNLIGITIAAAGWLHPVPAALLMLLSSATVIGKSQLSS